MGRRSRKRGLSGERAAGEAESRPPSSRAERDAERRRRAAQTAGGRPARDAARARRARTGHEERPPAPWGSFPLTELVVLLAIVLGALGFVLGGDRGRTMVVAAVALSCLAGLELSIREHFAGFRSHSTLIAAAAAIASMIGLFYAMGAGGAPLGLLALVGLGVFGAAFWALKQVFKRRSGGLGFR